MSTAVDDHQFETLLRGCDQVYTAQELKDRLAGGKRLRVKLGLDPTAPDLTLGHTVVLRKLRQFQDLGHKAVLIIGDYTAKIGDPTGRSKTRPVLSDEEIKTNADTYMQQAGKVLDLGEEKLEVRHNSEWLEPMDLAEVIKLMSRMTVARMLERDTFAKRRAADKEIFLHELLYPLMQAHDSVAVEADVELGATDQTFNNLCGRDLQRSAGQPPQIVMVMPILVGIDGTNKMSKSLGNHIGITDRPGEMFGKVMRIPDECMGNYFELLTELPETEIAALIPPKARPEPAQRAKGGVSGLTQCNPRDTKEKLAKMIVTQYHSAKAAESAADEFKRVHGGGGGLPDEIPEVGVPASMVDDGKIVPIDVIIHCGFAKSRGEARRLVAEHGVRLNGKVIADAMEPMAINTGDVFQRGKRRFVRLKVR